MAVLVLVVAAAVWLWPGDAPPSIVEPSPPVVAAVNEPSAEIPQEAPSVVAVPDAATPEPVHEVQFTLLRDGGTVVGERLTLTRGREQIGGTINVMGAVTLPLTPGEWNVRVPWKFRSVPEKVQITPDSGAITLTLVPRDKLSGCIVDAANQPVDAEVHLNDGLRLRPSVLVGADGCFSVDTPADEVDIWVEDGKYRSLPRHVELPAHVVLRAEPLFSLSVDFMPEDVHPEGAWVSHRLGVSKGSCNIGCTVLVPAGEYTLLAAGVLHEQLQFARRTGVSPSKDSEVKLSLAAAPDVTGTVRSAAGIPLPNVPLRFFSTDAQPREVARTLTRSDGSFSIEPQLFRAEFPSWRITAEPPWQLTSPAMVSFGDAPVQLTASMITP